MEKISIVIPVYNEEDNIVLAYNAVQKVMSSLAEQYTYEIIFTDNHSSDSSFETLQKIAEKDKRVKVARLSANFGYQKSVYTAYLLTSGDAVIQLDCDLQDPPEMIVKFLDKWKEGFFVVYGVRMRRKEMWLINYSRKLFYRLIDFLSETKLPYDAGDFRLVDKRIIDELRKLYDYAPYIRGTIASIGFKQIGIPYDRLERKSGKSKFRFKDLISLGMDGVLNHSIKLLRFATYTGAIVFMVSIFLMIVYMLAKLLSPEPWPAGFATITILILLSLSLNSLFLGIIGEYIGRIYHQSKMRPISIIEKKLNFDEESQNT
tara:strand:+ start:2063 stop:3016 length:954 start_codon:yes stop_codon:yes gene_type:complete